MQSICFAGVTHGADRIADEDTANHTDGGLFGREDTVQLGEWAQVEGVGLGDWTKELAHLEGEGYHTLDSLEYPEHHDAG
jgi:hypothetical protein